MFPNKGKNKNLLKNLLSSHSFNLGCGGCSDVTRPNNNVYEPKPKFNPNKPTPSSSSSFSDGMTSSTFSPPAQYNYYSDEPGPSRPDEKNKKSKNKDKDKESAIAVVKDSEDPYEDFRESMLQMIMEKEIFSQEDLHRLLRCFLRLNSPAHRPLILRAFVDVCHSLVADQPYEQQQQQQQH